MARSTWCFKSRERVRWKTFSATLLNYIREQGGRITLHDKSPAEEIYETFGVSKKTFKKAVGDLYKKHLIRLLENGIELVDSSNP